MRLRTSSPPPSVIQTASQSILRLPSDGGMAIGGAARTRPQALSLALPHPVYTLSLEGIANGTAWRDPAFSGWRLLVLDDVSPIASVFVPDSGVGGAGPGGRGGQVTQGPFVVATAERLQQLESAVAPADVEYELCLVQVPSLYVLGFWLRGDDSSRDLIAPLADRFGRFEPNGLYQPGEFTDRLRDEARRRIGFDDRPQ